LAWINHLNLASGKANKQKAGMKSCAIFIEIMACGKSTFVDTFIYGLCGVGG
jgi:hypothetical protein